MVGSVRAVSDPTTCRRLACGRHLETTEVATHFRYTGHLIDLFSFFFSKVHSKIVEIVAPIITHIIVAKAKIIVLTSGCTSCFAEVIVNIPGAGAAIISFTVSHFLFVIPTTALSLCCFQILQGGFLDRKSRPVIFPNNRSRWLEETTTSPATGLNLLHQPLNRSLLRFDGNLDTLGILLKAMGLGTNVRQWQISALFQHLDTLSGVAQKQSIVVSAHNVLAHTRDLEHLAQFLSIAGEQIQERKTIEVLGTLVAHLDDLVVTLTEGLTTELAPNLTAVSFAGSLLEREGTFHGGLNVTAGKSKAETSTRLADKVQGHLREAFGLKVRNNGSAAETAMADHLHNLSVPLGGKGKFKPGFGGVNADDAGPRLPVEAE
mmetsp:Transcript_7051/g.13798  ORF Transcript_7051/g.13798 Transcript_7051/m.13798 type:complete len:376 (-) Transcript_7051:2454-3581(-)